MKKAEKRLKVKGQSISRFPLLSLTFPHLLARSAA